MTFRSEIGEALIREEVRIGGGLTYIANMIDSAFNDAFEIDEFDDEGNGDWVKSTNVVHGLFAVAAAINRVADALGAKPVEEDV